MAAMSVSTPPVRVSELADLVKGIVRGDASAEIRGAASVEGAGPRDLVFATARPHLERALAGTAACILTTPELHAALEAPGELPVILVEDPRLAFARALRHLYPDPKRAPGVHPSAVVDPDAVLGDAVYVGPHAVVEAGARVGDGSSIGAGSYVGEGVTVGRDCVLHPRVTLYAQTRVGDRVVAHSGAVIGSDGFGYATDAGAGEHEKFPQVGIVELGDDVEVGANTTIDRGALDPTVVGAGTKIDNLVQLGHNVSVGERCIVCAQVGVAGSAEIGDAVILAGQVGIANKVRLEPGSVVGAKSGVSNGKRVRSGQVVMGSPIRPLKDYMRVQAHLSRLPELARRVKALESARDSDDGESGPDGS